MKIIIRIFIYYEYYNYSLFICPTYAASKFISQIDRRTAFLIWMISYIVLPSAANTFAASDRPDIRSRKILYWFHDRRSRRFSICFAQLRYTCSRFEVVVDHNTMSEIINNNKWKIKIFHFSINLLLWLHTGDTHLCNSKSNLILDFVRFLRR